MEESKEEKTDMNVDMRNTNRNVDIKEDLYRRKTQSLRRRRANYSD